jgi:hypothetical protein
VGIAGQAEIKILAKDAYKAAFESAFKNARE